MNEKITALIPARGGSKGVPKKNIYDLSGFPLIAYSILACKLCPQIGRIIVSTDEQEIANISKKYGAEVPFIRPAKFATDSSTDLDVVKHFYSEEGPQDIAFVRPTTPLRDPVFMGDIIDVYNKNKNDITGLRTAHELSESPYKFFKIVDGFFTGFFEHYQGFKDYENLLRKFFPIAYNQNG